MNNGYETFLESEKRLQELFQMPFDCSQLSNDTMFCSMNGWPLYYNDFYQPFVTNYTITYSNIKEKDMMTLFNWFLVEKFVEGKEPSKTGFITAVDEESAREFIVRSLNTDTFNQYKDGELALVVTEVDSWEI